MAVTLERRELTVAEADSLAAACEKQLGYSALRATAPSKALVGCFEKVGIRPFDGKQVEAYMAASAAKANAPGQRAFNWWLAVSGVALVVLPPAVALALGTPVALLGWVLLVWAAVNADCYRDISWWAWRHRELKGYPRPVPHYALELAVNLGRELTTANVPHTFYVHELAREEATGDPFLSLWCEGRWHYLEVWDEPAFGSERTV